ncbi:MAG TPA: CDP-diacylglycerol--glycerol-3-phosphate 3-phosphatidyltransferase [Deltaproteobacteria bacterium]|nr:CDP-diacylglycerol--glycerol-3-phosphate 3-phosphatidyltransferase [Deltaproteobacteria bacterium]
MESDFRQELWNLPNILSLVRIGASPLLILLLLSPGRTLSIIAAFIFLAVCLTDWLDGYLARTRGSVTSLGKFLDPLADKLLIVTALIMLISLERVPAWMVALIVSREIAVTGLRTMAVRSGIVIGATWLGKLKTVSQIAAITALLLHYELWGVDFQLLGEWLIWLALVVTIWSGVDYFVRFFRKTLTHNPPDVQ